MAEIIALSVSALSALIGLVVLLFRKLFKLIAEIDENYNKEE